MYVYIYNMHNITITINNSVTNEKATRWTHKQKMHKAEWSNVYMWTQYQNTATL